MEIIFHIKWTGFFHEFDLQCRVVPGYTTDPAHISVENTFIIVVTHLHHFVANAEHMPIPFNRLVLLRIQMLLQFFIENANSGWPAIHRRKHLNISHWIKMIARRQTALYQVHDELLHFYRIFLRQKKEIAISFYPEIGHLPGIDTVSI